MQAMANGKLTAAAIQQAAIDINADDTAAQAWLEVIRAEDVIEQTRIDQGKRAPHNFQKRAKRAPASGRSRCAECGFPIPPGTRMIVEEDLNCYTGPHRYRSFHPEHHPDAINREFEKVRQQLEERRGSAAP